MSEAGWDELAALFRRYEPLGTLPWNFAAAFEQLYALVEQVAGAEPEPPRRTRVANRTLAALDLPTHPATHGQVAEVRHRLDEGLEATMEALRFLAARIERLEGASASRSTPVDGMAWLVEPPDLLPWRPWLLEWLATPLPGALALAECGDGRLGSALGESLGVTVNGVEPRGPLALAAARRGLAVHAGPVIEWLGEAQGLGALVLSDAVDRLAREDLVQLVALAVQALAADGWLVVIGRHAERSGWSAAANDLLPGRPLHPETWQLLLERAGLDGVAVARGPGPSGPTAPAAPATYAVRGRRRR